MEPSSAHTNSSGGRVCALIKPQFEAGRAEVGKGGIVRDAQVRLRVVRDLEKLVLALIRELGLTPLRRHGVKHARNTNALNAGERALRESEQMFASRKRAN